MTKTSGLTLRQFQRDSVEFAAELLVSAGHAAQVRFTASAGALGQHAAAVKVVDISSGGMGLESRHFIPRHCEGTIRVYDAAPASDDRGSRNLLFEHAVKVRRVFMMNADPVYALGVAFIDPEPGIEVRIKELRKSSAKLRGDQRDAA